MLTPAMHASAYGYQQCKQAHAESSAACCGAHLGSNCFPLGCDVWGGWEDVPCHHDLPPEGPSTWCHSGSPGHERPNAHPGPGQQPVPDRDKNSSIMFFSFLHMRCERAAEIANEGYMYCYNTCHSKVAIDPPPQQFYSIWQWL
jgi:hypothetical protein